MDPLLPSVPYLAHRSFCCAPALAPAPLSSDSTFAHPRLGEDRKAYAHRKRGGKGANRVVARHPRETVCKFPPEKLPVEIGSIFRLCARDIPTNRPDRPHERSIAFRKRRAKEDVGGLEEQVKQRLRCRCCTLHAASCKFVLVSGKAPIPFPSREAEKQRRETRSSIRTASWSPLARRSPSSHKRPPLRLPPTHASLSCPAFGERRLRNRSLRRLIITLVILDSFLQFSSPAGVLSKVFVLIPSGPWFHPSFGTLPPDKPCNFHTCACRTVLGGQLRLRKGGIVEEEEPPLSGHRAPHRTASLSDLVVDC